MRSWPFLLFLSCLIAFSGVKATASTSSKENEGSLENLSLTEISQDIQDLLGRVEKLEEQQKEGMPSWVEKFTFKGDFRFRYESKDMEGSKRRSRGRMRLRLFTGVEVNDVVDVGMQIASGDDDPVSTNQSFDDAFTTKDIRLDMAYFDYHPEVVEDWKSHIIGGKMKNPFHTPQKSPLVWDPDLRPEGAALKIEGVLDSVTVFGNFGGFWVQEEATETDIGLWGAQLGTTINLADTGDLTFGAGWYQYSNIKGAGPLYDNDLFGNLADGIGNFAEGYALLNGFAEFTTKVAELPFAVYADYVTNLRADKEDVGWLAGFKLGKAKEWKTWEIGYFYEKLERDAVVGAFTDSDFADGGSDVRGHKIMGGLGLDKNWTFKVTYYINDVGISLPSSQERDYDRLQVDLYFKF